VPNPFFQFKKFVIRQDRCAMKVCTDSCLFGAWTANYLERKSVNVQRLLDVGAGTGLLSLMAAQKTNAGIDAVEIDRDSFEQAASNIAESPFSNQIHVFNADFKEWMPEGKYDMIISNPPFYENDLVPADDGRHLSKHSRGLSLEALLNRSMNLLNAAGCLAVLLPVHRAADFERIAGRHSLFVTEKMLIRQTPQHPYFRAILLLGFDQTPPQQTTLEIKNEGNDYSAEFVRLLKDYYLPL